MVHQHLVKSVVVLGAINGRLVQLLLKYIDGPSIIVILLPLPCVGCLVIQGMLLELILVDFIQVVQHVHIVVVQQFWWLKTSLEVVDRFLVRIECLLHGVCILGNEFIHLLLPLQYLFFCQFLVVCKPQSSIFAIEVRLPNEIRAFKLFLPF